MDFFLFQSTNTNTHIHALTFLNVGTHYPYELLRESERLDWYILVLVTLP